MPPRRINEIVHGTAIGPVFADGTIILAWPADDYDLDVTEDELGERLE